MTKTAEAAAKAKAPAGDDKKDAVRPLTEPRLKLVVGSASDIENRFAAVTPLGTPFEHVLEPEFWALTAYKLRPGDRIGVHTDDMTYFAEVYVRDVSGAAGSRLNNRATVSPLGVAEWGALKRELQTKSHEVRFLGPHEKWTVISKADQRPVKSGFGTQDEAMQWMKALI